MLFDDKLFRYKEFCIPFAAYRGGDLSRADFLEIIQELREIQNEQHSALLEQIENDVFLRESHSEIYEDLQEITTLFDEAIDITEDALTGDPELEEELFEEAMETFKRGNIMLSDAFYDLDEIWERSVSGGTL